MEGPVNALADLRTWPGQLPTPATYYCPDCDCRKSGDVRDANRRDEGCQDEECRCHTEATCPSCGEPDGLRLVGERTEWEGGDVWECRWCGCTTTVWTIGGAR